MDKYLGYLESVNTKCETNFMLNDDEYAMLRKYVKSVTKEQDKQ